ncbi:hypothetical protein [Haloarcula litorea]|uniref:hypothetical protein n=1 Tax=Haloarcula litorea TaxID=3032579 RepID=UPI0023E8F515|nr:hypothetical protein [Halomicroarcula sp. GDY20]
MSSDGLSGDVRQRLGWAIREAVVITGIFVFWLAIALIIVTGLSLIAFLIQTLRLDPLRFVYEFAQRGDVVWGAVLPFAGATAGIYALARVGTILISRYQSDSGE